MILTHHVQVVHGAFILGIQEQSSDAAVALMDAGPLGEQVLQNLKGTELPGVFGAGQFYIIYHIFSTSYDGLLWVMDYDRWMIWIIHI